MEQIKILFTNIAFAIIRQTLPVKKNVKIAKICGGGICYSKIC